MERYTYKYVLYRTNPSAMYTKTTVIYRVFDACTAVNVLYMLHTKMADQD